MDTIGRDIGLIDGAGTLARRAPVDLGTASVALVHDYLTQRGGAERVVLSLHRAFPHAPLHTSLYEATGTYAEFRTTDLRPAGINRLAALRSDHRLALPVLAPTFSLLEVEGDVVVCSSSGWAHGVHTEGRKVVYCHSPAKWLHQPDRYPLPGRLAKAAFGVLRSSLLAWDLRAAASADRYLVNSTAVQGWVRKAYGIDAEVVPPPGGIDASGAADPVPGLDAGFLLCVSRLLPYKNVDVVLRAMAMRPDLQLVVVGHGPEAAALASLATSNVTLLTEVSDAQLRWLYRSSSALVSAAHEDFGLTPLEAGSFGKPTVALRWGGFLDTVVEGENGVFMDDATPEALLAALGDLASTRWDEDRIRAHVEPYSEERFIERMRSVVAEEACR